LTLEIYEKSDDEDMSFFLRLGFWALKTLRRSNFEQIMRDHPDATDEEAYEVCAKETTEYMDFADPKVKVFIAFSNGERCGYLWIATRNSKDAWDCEQPQWIYDIVVDSAFQGRGIGTELMKKGEEYARSLFSNIGLFVHSDNDPAIALYKRQGYLVKVVPMSKRVEETSDYYSNGSMSVRELDDLPQFLRDLEYERFKKKVLFSVDADEAQVSVRFVDHLNRTKRTSGKYQRLAAFGDDDSFLGSIWVGPSGFSDNVSMVYGLVIANPEKRQDVGSLLFNKAEAWSRDEGFSTLYILLHAEDDLDPESLKSMGYSLPGFFMEKRLK
jgi:ribosomal protein S18 acetylase RimI-like enzyme